VTMPIFDSVHLNLTRLVFGALSVARIAVRRERDGDANTASEPPPWANDRVGYWPVSDRGGPMSEYIGPGDQGMIGVLAKIELNQEDGRDPGAGLPDDPLQPREATD
jgi:hypothetical protein